MSQHEKWVSVRTVPFLFFMIGNPSVATIPNETYATLGVGLRAIIHTLGYQKGKETRIHWRRTLQRNKFYAFN